ncbi:MAG TPA: hypothetical protein GXZ60_07290 [Intrasporangiaceae bacterium]|nr:hypothetical protein [Intrasporangiaceae bacterium]
MRVVGAVAVAVAMTVSGCGGGTSGENAKASQAIADSMLESNDGTFDVTEQEAKCVGDGFVDKIGVDKLKEYGFLTEDADQASSVEDVDMSKDDAEKSADVMLGCFDFKKMMVDSMTEDMEGGEASVKCVNDAVSDDAISGMLVALLSGDEDGAESALMTEELMSCLLEAALDSE